MLGNGVEWGELASREHKLCSWDEFSRRCTAVFIAQFRVIPLDCLLKLESFLHLKPTKQNSTCKREPFVRGNYMA